MFVVKIGAKQSFHCVSFLDGSLFRCQEQMSGIQYNEKSDIWSLGCLLYELCALHPPFIAGNQLELATKICTGRFQRIPSNYSDELHSLISTLLLVDVRILFESNAIHTCKQWFLA